MSTAGKLLSAALRAGELSGEAWNVVAARAADPRDERSAELRALVARVARVQPLALLEHVRWMDPTSGRRHLEALTESGERAVVIAAACGAAPRLRGVAESCLRRALLRETSIHPLPWIDELTGFRSFSELRRREPRGPRPPSERNSL